MFGWAWALPGPPLMSKKPTRLVQTMKAWDKRQVKRGACNETNYSDYFITIIFLCRMMQQICDFDKTIKCMPVLSLSVLVSIRLITNMHLVI